MSSTSRSQGDRTRVADGRQKGRPVDGPASNSQTKQGYSSVADNAREPAANGGSYRILLLGKSGVGKSSLIQTILKVPGIDASHYNRGTSDINKEYKSSEYPQFILHDSMGFEFGDLEETKTVKNFIKNRSEDKEVSEQVQAIWYAESSPESVIALFTVNLFKAMYYGSNCWRTPF
ncbi:hypothetical protein FRC03_001351 [Tulasnella sp. 419]|nr:hypothetical protein FRC03_001351 [Tulasnella sp. 419]